jgi:hypothetical protein
MDIYTTSFTYPRRPRHIHSPHSSLDYQGHGADLRAPSTESFSGSGHSLANHLQQQNPSSGAPNVSDATTSTPDNEAVQKLAMMAMQMHGCHVSYFAADQGRGWNFHITGAYQQVMVARGMILKECPIQVCLTSFVLLLGLLSDVCLS